MILVKLPVRSAQQDGVKFHRFLYQDFHLRLLEYGGHGLGYFMLVVVQPMGQLPGPSTT
jgi:hypothetical protein